MVNTRTDLYTAFIERKTQSLQSIVQTLQSSYFGWGERHWQNNMVSSIIEFTGSCGMQKKNL